MAGTYCYAHCDTMTAKCARGTNAIRRPGGGDGEGRLRGGPTRVLLYAIYRINAFFTHAQCVYISEIIILYYNVTKKKNKNKIRVRRRIKYIRTNTCFYIGIYFCVPYYYSFEWRRRVAKRLGQTRFDTKI